MLDTAHFRCREIMADIMIGVQGAGNFANGLIKNADGSIPLLQHSYDKYYQDRRDGIGRRLGFILPGPTNGDLLNPADFTVYAFCSITKSFCHMGSFRTILYDFLNISAY